MILQQVPRIEMILYMEEVLEELWELSLQLGDLSIQTKIRELSKELDTLKDAACDE
jgi:hypothetical protein